MTHKKHYLNRSKIFFLISLLAIFATQRSYIHTTDFMQTIVITNAKIKSYTISKSGKNSNSKIYNTVVEFVHNDKHFSVLVTLQKKPELDSLIKISFLDTDPSATATAKNKNGLWQKFYFFFCVALLSLLISGYYFFQEPLNNSIFVILNTVKNLFNSSS
jgi:Ni,Fe-hydrogenase I cytochrome b subunit